LASCGAWPELVGVPTSQLAVLPSTVTDAEAATLPTVGLTALRALDLAGAQLAKRVLVTGATEASACTRCSSRRSPAPT
jgi:NADPH:quinone reductase-like Zn-dependent oxidoreductase